MNEYLFQEIKKRGLASFTKGDLEALVFYALVFKTESFKENLLPQDIDNRMLINISQEFRLSSLQTRNIISRATRLYGVQNTIDVKILLKTHFKDHIESFGSGNLEIVLPNPVQREAIETEILKTNGFNNSTFNKDIMIIPLSSMVKIFGKDESKVLESLFKELNKTAKKDPSVVLGKIMESKNLKEVFIKLFTMDNFIAVSTMALNLFSVS